MACRWSLLRWRLLRRTCIRIRCRRGAWTIAWAAFWHTLAVGEFEVVDLSRHRHLADAEALARDRHLAAEAIVRMGPDASADRICAGRHQLEAGRAEASSFVGRMGVAGDDDQRAQWCRRRRCVGDAGAALDMGVGRADERRRCGAGLGRGERWTWRRLCLNLRGRDRGRLANAVAITELLPGKAAVSSFRILGPSRHHPTEAKREAETEPEQSSGGKAGHSKPRRLKMPRKNRMPRCSAAMI